MDTNIKQFATVAGTWQDVVNTVIQDGSHHTPRMQREMQRAFYAGWAGCITAIHDAYDKGMTPDECGTMLKAQKDELLVFFKALLEQALAAEEAER